jgi:CheY-like chemotaxis protein
MEAIGQLAGGVAHDVNNILTALIGYGSLLCMKMEPEDPLKEYAENIVAVSEKAANITRSLLTFSRKRPVELMPLTLRVLVRDMESLLKRLLSEDIEFETVMEGEEISVMADAGCINQILLNLATNARDAMPDGGRFTITVCGGRPGSEKHHSRGGFDRSSLYAEIAFSDTGCGMDEKTAARIFEPFFTTKEEGKGTGLGLSIVYGIVREHNGFIEVESEPGKGSTFRIFLPAAGGLRHEHDESREYVTGGTETILIAEDHAEVRLFMREILAMSGYTVIEAYDGDDAIEKFVLSKDRISLLILDVVMPGKNGKEVYEEIRRYGSGIKVLFASGHTGDTVDSKGVHVETVDFISKPMSADELLLKVRELLDR